MAGIEGDVWKQEHDHSKELQWEPGPIELNRYVINSHAHTGIGTFMSFPVCITPEDLEAGNVDVIGAPLDMSFGQRGTAYRPRALRTADRYLPGGLLAAAQLTHTHVMVKPFDVLKCVDYGDSNVDPLDIDSLNPAYALGTGTPEPGGLTTREAFKIVRRLGAETNVVGLELVEVAPGGTPDTQLR